jgi:predicted secreted Zn-dependent protease
LLGAWLLAWPAVAQAEWAAIEKVETYAITGQSGLELYESIGARGPELRGGGRAIAHTNFKLTWQRNYVPGKGGCTLASARPKLIITYTLPKPAAKLPQALDRKWQRFIAGLHEHELEHGVFIKDMVRKIEVYSVGLNVADDPDCSRIRTVLTQRLGELSQQQRQRSRDFDRIEHGEGGAIRRLILELVNGGS